MRLDFNGLNVTRWAPLEPLDLGDTDLRNRLHTASVTVDERDKDGISIPVQPALGLTGDIYDDDNTTRIFAGRIGRVTDDPQRDPVAQSWVAVFQSEEVRLQDAPCGSLNRAGTFDHDRTFVIAIVRDCLKAQTFGSGTGLQDRVITANEPDWLGVEATAYVSGQDWSYMAGARALGMLEERVPNVAWRIRPSDLRFEWGLIRDVAPFALSTAPNGTTLRWYGSYAEQYAVGPHRNKVRLGGAGAAEATAIDIPSYERYGHRILEAPYENDEAIPAADLTRQAHAKLRTLREQQRASLLTHEPGLRAGIVVDIVNARKGRRGLAAPMVQAQWNPLMARSPSGELAKNSRGRWLVQRVRRRVLKPGLLSEYIVELGDARRDLAQQVAILEADRTGA